MGIFITFEGGDGAGKTTQAALLAEKLSSNREVVQVHEPGGTELGDFIHSYLRHRSQRSAEQGYFMELGSPGFPDIVGPIAELFLFEAARAQLVQEVIKPALERDAIVVCDRFADSTTAYQGNGMGIPEKKVQQMNEIATDGIKPDLTILLDIDPEAGLKRVPTKRDRMEQRRKDFHRRVRDGYRMVADKDPERFLMLDATRPENEVETAIWNRVSQLLALPETVAEPLRLLL